jgi:hypothetical protein
MLCFVIGEVVFQRFEVSQCLHLQGQAAQEEFQVPEPKDEGTVNSTTSGITGPTSIVTS